MISSRILCALTVTVCATLASVRPAAAKKSSFRVIDVAPTAKGCVATITYDNLWLGHGGSAANRWVQLSPLVKGSMGLWDNVRRKSADPKQRVRVDMLGAGTTKVPLDYGAQQLKSGMTVMLCGDWERGGHAWGHGPATSSGEFVLPSPAAKKNSAFRRRTRRAALPSARLRALRAALSKRWRPLAARPWTRRR